MHHMQSDCKPKMHSGSLGMVAPTDLCRGHFHQVLIYFPKYECIRMLDSISGQKTERTSTPKIFFLWYLHNRRISNFLFYNPTVRERLDD